MSVFRGGFTRDAAEQVAGANLRILLALVNKSLLQRQADNGRFAIHELLRQFAAKQRHQQESLDTTAHDHCHYFAKFARKEAKQAIGFFSSYLAQLIGPDIDNLRRAWDYALAQGLATELSDLAEAIVALNYIQGAESSLLLQNTIQSLTDRGANEKERPLLHMRFLELETLASTNHDFGSSTITRIRL